MTEAVSTHGDDDALLSRLKVIEDQPLETRAEHLAQVYEELRAALEAGDSRSGDTAASRA